MQEKYEVANFKTKTMKIIITSTPEYSQSELQEVINLLNQQRGYISFELGETLSVNQFSKISGKYSEFSKTLCFSFDELFDLTEQYRTIKDIPEEHYVALITSYKNKPNWFSAFRDRNLFVDANDWEYFSKKDAKYGIAFQVIENLIQGFMKLDINNPHNEPNIHFESIGCLNDFCGNKKDVMFKLRQGYLCDDCTNRLEKEQVDMSIMSELMQIINVIRDEMVNKYRLLANKPETQPLEVDEKGNIKVGEKLIELFPQGKTLYFLFLNYINGISSRKLRNYEEVTTNLYKKIKGMGASEEPIKALLNKRFYEVKSNVNTKLNKILGNEASENYIIDQKQGESFFKINIEEDKININDKFKIS